MLDYSSKSTLARYKSKTTQSNILKDLEPLKATEQNDKFIDRAIFSFSSSDSMNGKSLHKLG